MFITNSSTRAKSTLKINEHLHEDIFKRLITTNRTCDSKVRKHHYHTAKNNFTFKPTLIKSTLFKANSFSTRPFLQRQDDYVKKITMKREKMTEEKFNYDTNNLKLKTANKIPLNRIIEHYDREMGRYYQHKQNLESKYYPESMYSTADNTNEKSKKLISVIYTRTFEKMFSILDSDEDGLISPITISKSINSLDANIKKIIEPIINELNEESYTLSKEEFVSALFELYKDLTVEQKNELIVFYNKSSKLSHKEKKEKKENNFAHLTFKPKINKRSKSIAAKYESRMRKEMEKRKIIPPSLTKRTSSSKEKDEYFNSFNRTKSASLLNMESKFTSIHNFTFDNFKNAQQH